MKIEQLQKILENESGVRLDSEPAAMRLGAWSSYLVGDELDLTIQIELGHEAVAIARVRRITLGADLVVIETHKSERIYLGADAGIRALKFMASDTSKKAAAGFAGLR
jgi:hypothetical protein